MRLGIMLGNIAPLAEGSRCLPPEASCLGLRVFIKGCALGSRGRGVVCNADNEDQTCGLCRVVGPDHNNLWCLEGSRPLHANLAAPHVGRLHTCQAEDNQRMALEHRTS